MLGFLLLFFTALLAGAAILLTAYLAVKLGYSPAIRFHLGKHYLVEPWAPFAPKRTPVAAISTGVIVAVATHRSAFVTTVMATVVAGHFFLCETPAVAPSGSITSGKGTTSSGNFEAVHA